MPQLIPIIVGAAAKAVGFSKLIVGLITLAASIITTVAFKPKSNIGQMGTAINMSRDPSAPREYIYGETRIGGTMEFVDSSGTNNEILWLVISYADHEIDSFTGFYIDDVEVSINGSGNVTTSPFSGFVSFYGHLGTDSQTVDSNMAAASASWGTNHRLRGTAYGVWKLTFARDVFPTGLPNLSVKIKGKKVYDPRLDSTVSGGSGAHRANDSNTWEWAENVVLCSLDVLRDDFVGPDMPISAFEDANLIASANVCDESVSVKAGGSLARYAMNGAVNADMSGEAMMDFMMPSMAGTFTYSGGIFRFHPGQYDTPNTDIITDDQIVEIVNWNPTPGANGVVNQVKGRFIYPEVDHQPDEYPARLDATAKAEDGGFDHIRDLDLPFEQDHRRAQRIAEIVLRQERQRGTGKIRCTMAALNIKVWDVLKITVADLGWSEKIFRVVGWQQNPDFTIDLDIKEEESAVYDWTAADDEIDFSSPGAPSIFAPGVAPNVTNLVVVAASYVGSDGSVTPALKVTYSDPGPFVADTIIQISDDNGATWLEYGSVDNNDDNDGIVITGLAKGTTWKVRAVHRTTFNVISYNGWTTSASITLTDSTIAGTIVNQGDLALLDNVDTPEIAVDAATKETVATGSLLNLTTTYQTVLSQAYTPYSSSSKILLFFSAVWQRDITDPTWNGCIVQIKRGTTVLVTDLLIGGDMEYRDGDGEWWDIETGIDTMLIDNDPGASATTYTVEVKATNGLGVAEVDIVNAELAIFEGKR